MRKSEITGIKSFAPLSKGTHVNAPIVKELMVIRQLFVNNSCARFHENVANGLVAVTRTWFSHKFLFLFLTEVLHEYNVLPCVT